MFADVEYEPLLLSTHAHPPIISEQNQLRPEPHAATQVSARHTVAAAPAAANAPRRAPRRPFGSHPSRAQTPSGVRRFVSSVVGRGLHSFTVQLNLSAVYGIGGA